MGVLRLVAHESRVDGIGVRRLVAAIEFHPSKYFVTVAEFIVNSAHQQPFAISVRNGYAILLQARRSCKRSARRSQTAASVGAGILCDSLRICDARRGVVQAKHLLVEGNRCRITRWQAGGQDVTLQEPATALAMESDKSRLLR
jgi:hypothetical protein